MGSSDQHSRPRSCINNVIAIASVKTGIPWDGAGLYCDVGGGEDDMMHGSENFSVEVLSELVRGEVWLGLSNSCGGNTKFVTPHVAGASLLWLRGIMTSSRGLQHGGSTESSVAGSQR